MPRAASFSKYSARIPNGLEAGEDTIYIDEEKSIAVNKEVYNDEILAKLGTEERNLLRTKAIEVGKFSTLGTRFSEALGLSYKDDGGKTTGHNGQLRHRARRA